MPRYTIQCRVTLEGAQMIVEAEDAEGAMKKAKADEWEDIEYARTASVVDWEITGKPKADD